MDGSADGEATTITKSSNVEADVASIDGDIEPNKITTSSVPQEISHSSSSADFMVDIESWE